jgi:hypothetical protein
VYQNFFTRNIEPIFPGRCLGLKAVSFPTIVCYKIGWLQLGTFSQTLSPVQGSEPRILHWFSPTVSFSQPLVPARAHQPPDDAPPKKPLLANHDEHPNATVQFQSTTNASAIPRVPAGEAWTTQPGGRTLFGLRRSPRLFGISGPLQNATAASSTFVFAYIWLVVKMLGWSSTEWANFANHGGLVFSHCSYRLYSRSTKGKSVKCCVVVHILQI